jgi:hypothetical protein
MGNPPRRGFGAAVRGGMVGLASGAIMFIATAAVIVPAWHKEGRAALGTGGRGASTDSALGVQQDHEAALQYCRASGELGYAPAQFALAQLYEAGIVVPKSLAEARAWYAKAAAQGDQRAREQMIRIDRDSPEPGAPSGAERR